MECFFTIQSLKDTKLPLWIAGIGWDKYQQHRSRSEGFPFHQLAFCDKGKGKYHINGKDFTIEKGMIFYFPPDVSHEYYPVSEQWSVRWIIFDGASVETLFQAIGFPLCEVFCLKNSQDYVICYNLLWNILTTRKTTSMAEASGVFYQFITSMELESSHREYTGQDKKEKILDSILKYIRDTVQLEITLEELAEYAHISPSYLCRIFKQNFGMSPITYALRYKIKVAKEYLISRQDTSIKEISASVGFRDCSYFCAVFKKQEHLTPGQFRAMYRNN